MIKNSFHTFQSSSSKFLTFIASYFSHPIQRALHLSSAGLSVACDIDQISSRTQDLEPMFHDAGQLYWGSVGTWRACDNLLLNSKPHFIPNWSVQDIDTIDDWRRAELLHQLVAEGGF